MLTGMKILKRLPLNTVVFKKHVAENVQKNISAAGYDTERFTADNTVYNKLPECCHYQRKQSKNHQCLSFTGRQFTQ